MLNDLWGRSHVKQYMEEYIRRGLYHPLLLIGEHGVGKKYISKEIYFGLNCLGSDTGTDQCSCPSCIDPDPENYILYRLEKKSWGVNDIRTLTDLVEKPPLASRFRVIAIDQSEKITPEGTDTFLKIIEDVSPYNVFVFLTQYYREVMPTLRSRCWGIYLPPLLSTNGDEDVSSGIPALHIDSGLATQEKALLFIESFFEPEILLSTIKIKNDDIEGLVKGCFFIFNHYFSGTSKHVNTRIQRLEDKYGVQPLLIVYNNFNLFYQKIKRYPSIRTWSHFFETILETGLKVKTCLIIV